ncbi:MAG: AAA family ATPase [Promethearchaeota archaeon]
MKEKMTFTDEEIKNQLNKYGTVYLPSEIREEVDDILGNEEKKERLEDFFSSLKKYGEVVEKLREVKFTPNLTMLLYGPPGTGKTSLTRAMAKKFDIPLCVVEADRLVSPLLGDTVKNIRKVVENSSQIAKENGSFVLFFDEIDAIASERSSIHEVGEIKRAVISFLQIIDKVSYEGMPLAIFGATNHQLSLDSAVWRRFTFHLKFDFPDYKLRSLIIKNFLQRIQKAKIGIDQSILEKLEREEGFLNEIIDSLSDEGLDENTKLIRAWKELETKNEEGLLHLTRGYTGADIERGFKVALFKALQTDLITYNGLIRALQLVGGTEIHVNRQIELSEGKGEEKVAFEDESGPIDL